MSNISRRSFVKNTTLASLAVGIGAKSAISAWSKPLGANDDIRLAIVGVRGKGNAHIKDILKMKGVRIAALCDVDPMIMNTRKEELMAQNILVKTYTDIRKLLEDKEIDAVVIATPNHWHAAMTIWACQAGKDVYVEKPVAHNVWEGKMMVKAAHKYNRIVQSGTQARSNKDIPEIIEYIKEGHIGNIKWIHGLWYKRRAGIGVKHPWYPKEVDYDLYCGPSPMVPLERNRVHYDWHWLWRTGNGDLCNLGIHVFDVSRWMAGYEKMPDRILSLGGRYDVNDAGETPNTQLTIFDYPDIPIIMENRGLPMKPGVNAMDHHRGIREGVVVQCENGYYAGYHGGWIWDNNGKKIRQFAQGGAESHLPNFLECMRNRKYENLRAPIETGQLSTSACLIGNISYRLGSPAVLDHIREKIKSHNLASDTFNRMVEHLEVNNVDLGDTPLNLGPWLKVDPDSFDLMSVNGINEGEELENAKVLQKDPYRPPYEISTDA
jgi:predicted dehydrogenase